MGLRTDNSIFPSLPTNPQPSDVVSPIPGEDVNALIQQQSQQAQSFGQLSPQAEEAPIQDLPSMQEPLSPGGLNITPPTPEQRLQQRTLSNVGVESHRSPPGSSRTADSRKAEDDIRKEALANEFLLSLSDNERSSYESQKSSVQDFDTMLSDYMSDLPEEIAEPGSTMAGTITGQELLNNPTQAMGDFFKNTLTRMRSGLGRNEKEVMNAIQSAYGTDNVIKKGDRVLIRRRPGEPFTDFDPNGFLTNLDIIGDIADFSGPILEGAVTVGTEAMIAGTALAEVLGTGGAMTPLAIAQISGGLAVSGAAGAGARKSAIELLDSFADQKQRDQEISDMSEIAWAAGSNILTMGLGVTLKRGLRSGSGAAVQAFKNFSKSKAVVVEGVTDEAGKQVKVAGRAKLLAERQNKLIDDIAANFGLGKDTSPFINPAIKNERLKAVQKSATAVHGALDKIEDDLGKSIGAIRSDIENMTGKSRFGADSGLAKLKELLDDHDVVFDPETGLGSLPKVKFFTEEVSETAEGVVERNLIEQELPAASDRFALGGAEGSGRMLKELLSDYNTLLKEGEVNGGIEVRDLLGVISRYRSRSELGVDPITKLKFNAKQVASFRELQNAFASDRNSIFNEVFQGNNSPLRDTWENSFKHYSENIQSVLDLQTMFSKVDSQSSKNAVKGVFKPGNAIPVKQLKSLLGEQSQSWTNLKNSWLIDQAEKFTGSDGILRAKKMRDSVFNTGKMDKETLDEIMSPIEQVHLKKLLTNVEKVYFTDLIAPRDGVSNIIKDAFIVLGNALPTTKAGVINRWMKNAQVTEEVMDALRDQVRKAPTKTERYSNLKVMNYFQDFVNRSSRVRVFRKHPVTGKRVPTEMWVPRPSAPRLGAKAAMQGTVREASDTGLSEDQQLQLQGAGQGFEGATAGQFQQMEFGNIGAQ